MRGTSLGQSRDWDKFIEQYEDPPTLAEVIDWVNENLYIDQVFSNKEIFHEAREHNPDEVFENQELELWAQVNGYVKSDA